MPECQDARKRVCLACSGPGKCSSASDEDHMVPGCVEILPECKRVSFVRVRVYTMSGLRRMHKCVS